MRKGLILICALQLSLPPMVERAAAQQVTEFVTPQNVCEGLLVQAQLIDGILRSVSDKESADKAAGVLRQHLDQMQQLCRRLEQLPVENSEEARELAASMRSLTHVFQGYIPVVERLMEVNAYGSEDLVNVFHLYKVREGYRTESTTQDSPSLISHQEWVEALEFLLYHVRKIRKKEDFDTLIPEIEIAVERVERSKKAAETADSGEEQESIKPVRRQLEALLHELRAEQNRLHRDNLLSSPLENMLNRCYL